LAADLRAAVDQDRREALALEEARGDKACRPGADDRDRIIVPVHGHLHRS
jgi:hypothetical protein